ncbi:hypothetical protein [Hwanghaeella grinnelliae]|uniref:hypothetical protein n=1 Tax=Hwanghaeella grinnelliae TaxID=2500179 RepID=UPI00138666FF|nr:hypothetical protein [Hwanghaeella grinnelliae]
MRSLKKIVASIVVLVFVSACATQTLKQTDHLAAKRPNAGQRIVVLAPDVVLSEFTAGGLMVPNAEWTEKAQGLIKTEIQRVLADSNANVLYASDLNEPGTESETEIQLVKLHEIVGATIAGSQLAPIPTKKDVFDWSLGPDSGALRDEYGADYGLFLFVRDSYSTAGRVALNVFMAILGAPIQGGIQAGYASLVDLSTGEIVWFNMLGRKSGDLREAAPAAETVDLLLANFPTTPSGSDG